MASVVAYVNWIMQELGKAGPDVKARVEQAVKDTVVYLLSKNDGKFTKLERVREITLAAGDTDVLLPTDYNTVSRKFIEVDSAGKFVRKILCTTEADYYDRKSAGKDNEDELAYLRWVETGTVTRGWYLTFGIASTDTRYFRFFYFRIPAPEDADLINNTVIVKTGAKSRLPDLNLSWQYDLAIFTNMEQGFHEQGPAQNVTDLYIEPPAHIQRHNQMMHDIGQGK